MCYLYNYVGNICHYGISNHILMVNFALLMLYNVKYYNKLWFNIYLKSMIHTIIDE